jgi:mRNA-degrading endonuclease RelE of RelBE toxin-antitoxin system
LQLTQLKKRSFYHLSGKWPEKELSGYLSLQAKRFRIIYKVRNNAQTVEIHCVGHRKNIYELFREAIAALSTGGLRRAKISY